MKKSIMRDRVYVIFLSLYGISSQQSVAEISPSPQGIVILNVNDNTSGSADALLQVLKEVISQKHGTHYVPSGNPSPDMALSENRSISRGGMFSVTQFGVGASLLTAVGTWLKIKFLTNKSFRNSYWSAWRSDIPLQVLVELPDKDIVSELLPALRAYYDPGAQHDLNTFVLVRTFLADIEKEKELLQDLLWWYNALRFVGLYRFLGNEDIEYKVQKRCERLELLKHCICEWANSCLCQDNTTQVNMYDDAQ